MKKLLLFFAFILLLSISSCTKSSDEPGEVTYWANEYSYLELNPNGCFASYYDKRKYSKVYTISWTSKYTKTGNKITFSNEAQSDTDYAGRRYNYSGIFNTNETQLTLSWIWAPALNYTYDEEEVLIRTSVGPNSQNTQ